jgi:quaternary ammonium compound-resistance protein SugE
VLTIAAMALCVALPGIAMKSLPVGKSYAVWVGIGAIGAAILGLIVTGVVGPKLTTAA